MYIQETKRKVTLLNIINYIWFRFIRKVENSGPFVPDYLFSLYPQINEENKLCVLIIIEEKS